MNKLNLKHVEKLSFDQMAEINGGSTLDALFGCVGPMGVSLFAFFYGAATVATAGAFAAFGIGLTAVAGTVFSAYGCEKMFG